MNIPLRVLIDALAHLDTLISKAELPVNELSSIAKTAGQLSYYVEVASKNIELQVKE